MLLMVHGDHNIQFYCPINANDEISYTAEIVDIEDKGAAELLKI